MDKVFQELPATLKGKHVNGTTVNGRDKSLNTVNSRTVDEEIESLLKERNVTPGGVAKLLAELLDDQKSEDYYLILAKEHNRGRLLEAAHLTKDAHNRGIIRTTKPIYFQAILRKWSFRTKFKK